MSKTCKTCDFVGVIRNAEGRCKSCLRTCPKCNSRKDHRAELCRSCASTKAALTQWANPDSKQRIAAGLAAGGDLRRRRFCDLKYSDFRMTKPDGRHYTWYWDDQNVRRWMYRYQWVWIQSNGPIPAGCHIHHIDEDCTNDSLCNLQCLTAKAHGSHHLINGKANMMVVARGGTVTGKTSYVCEACGKVFQNYPRGNSPRKYCSQQCRINIQADQTPPDHQI